MTLSITKYFFFLFTPLLFGQIQKEINPPSNIKSIIFKGTTEDQFPIIALGESVFLEFDDLLASEQDYYYKIIHCNYDWTPSNLLKSQYLNGIDDQRITDYENSYSTLQPYSNYKLNIPNQEVKLKISGNHILEIYNDNYELQFSRRFIVYKNLVTVGATVKRSRDFNFLNEKQVVQFTINTSNFKVVNPKREVKVAIIQNYQWESTIYNIKPQYTIGNSLEYKYNEETSFYGGNEFFNFDTKDLRAPSYAISHIELTDIYQHYLFTDYHRNDRPYTYYPDINGDFVVRTLQGEDSSREAEYSNVHFKLPYTEEIGLNEVYIYGKHNNYSLDDENRMTYNEKTGLMEAAIKIKQGFYNYKYVIKNDDKSIHLNAISGNFHFTENNYTIMVYYRKFGDIYDSIIGIGTANSRNISN